MGVEVEGAGDQHVEAGVDRLARGGDDVLPADRAVFGADQDRGAALRRRFPPSMKVPLAPMKLPGQGVRLSKVMRSPLACCLTPSALR